MSIFLLRTCGYIRTFVSWPRFSPADHIFSLNILHFLVVDAIVIEQPGVSHRSVLFRNQRVRALDPKAVVVAATVTVLRGRLFLRAPFLLQVHYLLVDRPQLAEEMHVELTQANLECEEGYFRRRRINIEAPKLDSPFLP